MKPLVMKHWMTPSPHSIGVDQPLAVAHDLMRKNELRHLPVLKGGRLVGILSQRDLYFLETLKGVDTDKDRVSDAMTEDVWCVTEETPVEEIVSEMVAHKYGCAVVVDRAKVIGVFTTTDALALLDKLLTRP